MTQDCLQILISGNLIEGSQFPQIRSKSVIFFFLPIKYIKSFFTIENGKKLLSLQTDKLRYNRLDTNHR